MRYLRLAVMIAGSTVVVSGPTCPNAFQAQVRVIPPRKRQHLPSETPA